MRFSFFLFSLLFFTTACTPKFEKLLKQQLVESPKTQAETDKNLILQYAIDHKLDLQSTPSGIFYKIEKPGTGETSPDMNSIVTAHYHGTLLDGKVFDSSVDRGEPFQFQLGGVIKGWQEAIPMLKKGGKGKFYIPSELAYGSSGAGKDIGPNAVLVFDIELLDFYDKSEAAARQKKADDDLINKYLQENGLTAQKTASGIYYIMEKEGSGNASPDMNSIVTAHYHGTLLDGKVFDSSVDRGEPFQFQLGGVIGGWQEAIPLLKKGGKGKFFLPSDLAYGARGAGKDIGPNTVLVFDIELVDFFDKSEMATRQNKIDQELITRYLQENGLIAQHTASGIYYVMEKEGDRKGHPGPKTKVTVHYTGMLLDGTIFDSSVQRGEPATFGLNQVIKGWQESVPLLSKGGKGKFIIPSSLAYGARGAGGTIPPNAVLIFEIELLDF